VLRLWYFESVGEEGSEVVACLVLWALEYGWGMLLFVVEGWWSKSGIVLHILVSRGE
jgi:hypothetical protein